MVNRFFAHQALARWAGVGYGGWAVAGCGKAGVGQGGKGIGGGWRAGLVGPGRIESVNSHSEYTINNTLAFRASPKN